MVLADRIVRFITWVSVAFITVAFWTMVLGFFTGCTDMGCNSAPTLESPKPVLPKLADIIAGTWNSEEKGYASLTVYAPEAGRFGDSLFVSGVLVNGEMSRDEFVGMVIGNELRASLAPDYRNIFVVKLQVIDSTTIEWIEHDFVVIFHKYQP